MSILISCHIQNQLPCFQVHNEGMLVLRRFRNKKLRIICNIGNSIHQLNQFNHQFLSPSEQHSPQQSPQQLAYLSIYQHVKQLSDNRVLIIINTSYNLKFQVQQQPQYKLRVKCVSMLLLFGYLVASSFFYQYQGEFQTALQDRQFVGILAAMHEQLQHTKIHQLEQQIKYKSGYAKKPFLMCMCSLGQGKQELRTDFREFYKYNEEYSQQWNDAIDTIYEYFPERSAVNISHKNMIEKLCDEFIDQILGRQIFNFQITGLALQNLCFEICELLNSKNTDKKEQMPKLDLSQIYNKIILNQKTRIMDVSLQLYFQLLKNLRAKLPIPENKLIELHQEIEMEVIQQTLLYATNCMDLTEYGKVHKQITSRINAKFLQINLENYELLNKRYDQCYQLVQYGEEEESLLENICSENMEEVFTDLKQKLSIFIQQTIPDKAICTMLERLLDNYVENISEGVSKYIYTLENKLEESTAKYHQAKQDNKILQIKLRKLQQECFYTKQINYQFKNKLTDLNIHEESGPNADHLLKIKQLQQQIIHKDIYISSLHSTLQKIQNDFKVKHYKPKFSKNLQKLSVELTQKTNELYKIIAATKETQAFYAKIQIEFNSKKNALVLREKEMVEKMALETGKLNQAVKQNTKLEEIITQTRAAIKTMKEVENGLKQIIDEKETLQARCKCLLHETQGEMDQYKRALQLIGECMKKGKFDALKKYSKVIQVAELKQLIQKILNK